MANFYLFGFDVETVNSLVLDISSLLPLNPGNSKETKRWKRACE